MTHSFFGIDVYGDIDSTITSRLNAAGIQHRRCRIPNGPGIDARPHNKQMLLQDPLCLWRMTCRQFRHSHAAACHLYQTLPNINK
ncbi:hypothetical protein [Streptomyces chartreusis]|uniref:hypothetical protein n=1 Tax=Streptomyces chartreusis TaxID=1969 RepID=UPI0036295566